MKDIQGEVLCGTACFFTLWNLLFDTLSLVSQFTLLASTKKGSKPDFHGALGGAQAKELYQEFFKHVQDGYDPDKVKDGVFQAMMVESYYLAMRNSG